MPGKRFKMGLTDLSPLDPEPPIVIDTDDKHVFPVSQAERSLEVTAEEMTEGTVDLPHKKSSRPLISIGPSIRLIALGDDYRTGVCRIFRTTRRTAKSILRRMGVPCLRTEEDYYINVFTLEKVLFYIMDIGSPDFCAYTDGMRQRVAYTHLAEKELKEIAGAKRDSLLLQMTAAATLYGAVDHDMLMARLRRQWNALITEVRRTHQTAKYGMKPGRATQEAAEDAGRESKFYRGITFPDTEDENVTGTERIPTGE